MNILDYLKYIIDKKHNTHNFIEVFWGFFSFTGGKQHLREGQGNYLSVSMSELLVVW